MAKYWLCELGSLTLMQLVESDTIQDGEVASSAGASNEQRYFAMPEGVEASNCKLEESEGVYSLVEDDSKTTNPLWVELRKQRNVLLSACDWTQLSDGSLEASVKNEWITYRQALRDLPADSDAVESAEWPEEPS